MGAAKKVFVVESAIRCQNCGEEGSICVLPGSQLGEEELVAQRLANPDKAIVGLRTTALCPNCRRNLRREQGVEVVVAEDFVRMRAKHQLVEPVEVAREMPINPTLAALRRRFGI